MRSDEMFAYVQGLEQQVGALTSQVERLRKALADDGKPEPADPRQLTLPEKSGKKA